MIKIDEIEQFEKESLPQIKHQFWQLNSKTFPKEMDQFVVALKEKFADVFGKLGDIVQKKDCRVGKITISLIRQSVREGKPRCKLFIIRCTSISFTIIDDKIGRASCRERV